MLSSLPEPTITKPLLPANKSICLNISTVITRTSPLSGSGLSADSPFVTSWLAPAVNNLCTSLPVNSIGCFDVDTTGADLPVVSPALLFSNVDSNAVASCAVGSVDAVNDTAGTNAPKITLFLALFALLSSLLR